jgi:RNA polymerase sigma-32 factor
MRHPTLITTHRVVRITAQEERDLLLRWREEGDLRARDRVITGHLDVVRGVLSRMRRTDLSREDLFQDGVVGLFKAADRFDPDEGTRFSTYAAFWVRAEIQAAIGADTGAVRVPRSHEGHRVMTWYARTLSRLEADVATGRAENPKDGLERETARRMGVCPEQISTLLSLVRARSVPVITQTSDETEGEGHLPVSDLTPERILGERERQALFIRCIAEACEDLPDREREVIARRHLTEEPETFQSIGETFGLTRERIRQIETRALRTIRKRLCEKRGLKRVLIDSPQ